MTSPPSEPATRSDGELLRRFLDTRDESALSELVNRHAALVRGVCERWLGNTPDADDAFQATFLVLVRRGERILRPQSLAAWLYGVAQRIARRLRSDRSRASAVVKETDAMIDPDPLAEMATQHDVALFDAELARLPEKYRAPIVLHHLEGKTQREVAAELKLTEGAVDGLLKRGRSELRVRLARRGVVFGVTLAVLEKSHQALVAAPPEPLINATVQSILSFDPVLTPELPRTSSARLAQQEITTMSLYHAGKIAAWTVAAGMLLGTAGIGISTARHDLSLGVPALIASELDNLPAEPNALFSLTGENSQEPNPAVGNDLIDFVSVGEFDPATIGGFGGVLDAPGITVTTLETGKTTKVVIAGAFEKNDSTANTLRAVAITKDGKEIVPETRRAMAAGKGNQVVTLLCEFPIASTEIKRIQLQRKDRTESVTGAIRSDGTGTVSSPDGTPAEDPLRLNAKGDSRLETTFSNNAVASPEQPHQGERISIIGEIDLDGDGKSDREQFHNFIKKAGMIIDTEVDDEGNQQGDGITDEAKFLVVGKLPEVRGTGGSGRERARRFAETFSELRKAARLKNVRIVDVNDFLTYIGQPKPAQAVRPDPPPLVQYRELGPSAARITRALHEGTEVAFVDSTLYDALNFIEDLHKIEIRINEQELAEEGISSNTTINLELSGAELYNTLDLMLEPLQLDYVIKNEVLMITTRSQAASPKYHELRIYNVDGLPPLIDKSQREKADATQQIETAIQKAVAPKWNDGEMGTMQWAPAGLIVRTSQRMHAEIEEFLQQLRRADGQTE